MPLTFAEMQEAQGWIIIPEHQRGKETLGAFCINRQSNFPPTSTMTLPWFANLFGFKHIEDRDQNGKNILHHLFTAVACSIVASIVAVHCFRLGRPQLPGDYRKAIRHRVEGATPIGWTPLHCLCHGSDTMLAQSVVIKALLENKVVTVKDFDSMHTATREVIVFAPLRAMHHNAYVFLCAPHGARVFTAVHRIL